MRPRWELEDAEEELAAVRDRLVGVCNRLAADGALYGRVRGLVAMVERTRRLAERISAEVLAG